MATKPTDVPQWATDPGATDEPALGKKQAGWVVDEEPPAGWWNWLLNTLYEWILYVQDNQFSSAGGTSPFDFDDSVNIQTDLDVQGDLEVVGDTFHGDRTKVYAGVALHKEDPSNDWNEAGGIYTSSAGGQAWISLDFLRPGDQIKSVTIYFQRTTGDVDLALTRRDVTAAGAEVNIQTANITTGTSYTTQTWSSINHTVLADNGYALEILFADVSDFGGAEITWDRPGP